ncbi:hypothetical protein INT48_000755 [Thamnidium elegans]|uniref:Uncharacterized protein n=1 Tax=Thamnidium elegans TaxID=101142 RepID=A0A8H7VV50_9FUNG|nr:hypothetical protein INT48_000755 [Thamnidium elegans]
MEGTNEDQDLGEYGPHRIFQPIPLENSLCNDKTINERAVNFSRDCQLPKMNLSALYCLGVTIQEYSRYLATDILTEKRVTDGLKPLNSLFSQDELDEQNLDSIIEKYKPDDDVPAVVDDDDTPAATTHEKLTDMNGPYSFRNYHKFNVATSTNQSFYDKMLNSSDWRNVLKKKRRDPEADEQAAEKRREKNKLLAQKIASERVLQEERMKQEQKLKILQNTNNNNNNNQYQPQLEQIKPMAKRKLKREEEKQTGDIFDMSKKRKTINPKAKKKKKSANPF